MITYGILLFKGSIKVTPRKACTKYANRFHEKSLHELCAVFPLIIPKLAIVQSLQKVIQYLFLLYHITQNKSTIYDV